MTPFPTFVFVLVLHLNIFSLTAKPFARVLPTILAGWGFLSSGSFLKKDSRKQ